MGRALIPASLFKINEMKKQLFIIILLINSLYAFPTQLTVNQDGSGDYTLIQDAINAASTGDTVLVYPGTYFENVDLAGKNIVLTGLGLTTGDDSYKYITIIDGNNSGSAIKVNKGETDVLIYGLTAKNGNGTPDSYIGFTCGGGVFIKDSKTKLSNCIIKDNNAPLGKGGGVFIWNSQVEIKDCIISNNFCERSGGGIICTWFSTLNIEGSSISHNHSHTDGGGIAIGYESEIIFDTINLNSLYLNFASRGNDLIFPHSENPFPLKLDTFTVAIPTPYFVSVPDINGYEKDDLVLDAQHAAIEPYYGNLYVNPIIGNDSNVGNTEEAPLKTLAFAVTKIGLDSLKERNIYLANGIYSDSSNNEKFPINIRSRINFIGQSMKGVIFDGEYNTSMIAGHNEVSDYSFQKITFQRGRHVNYDMTILNREPFGLLYYENENVTLDSLTFKDAITNDAHKGFAIRNSGNTLISNSVFTKINGERALNIATWNFEDTAWIQNCRFINNKVDYNNPEYLTGGGLICGGANGVIIINNSLFDNNDTDCLWASNGQVFVSNSTFVNNSNDVNYTNAILVAGSNVDFYNCILLNNGSLPIWVGELNYLDAQLNIYNSLVEGNTKSITIASGGNLYYDSTNIDADPIFLGMWNDPYMISDGSPCIDAGTLANLPNFIELPEYDLAGNPRVVGDSIDMGAYEWNPTIVGFHDIGQDSDINKNTLLKVSPNPFRENTVIEFFGREYKSQFSEMGQTKTDFKIEVYDNYGRLVRNILSTTLLQNQKVTWLGDDNNGNILPAGIYNVVLFSGDREIESLKVVKQ